MIAQRNRLQVQYLQAVVERVGGHYYLFIRQHITHRQP